MMPGTVSHKEDAKFATISPGGFVLLAAIHGAAIALGVDLIITSGTDGCHSGEADPHHFGNAYDVRVHDFAPETQQKILEFIQRAAGPEFYAFIEDPGTPNLHIHCQVKKGTHYPPDTFMGV